jgi:hypothetical protein
LLLLQAFLDFSIVRSIVEGLKNFILIEMGVVLIAFAATVHIYRVTSSAR